MFENIVIISALIILYVLLGIVLSIADLFQTKTVWLTNEKNNHF